MAPVFFIIKSLEPSDFLSFVSSLLGIHSRYNWHNYKKTRVEYPGFWFY